MTEQEFRLRADQALEDLQQELLPLADEAGLEIDLRNGVLQIVFEEPEPAKFVVSADTRGSANMRRTWARSTLGWRSSERRATCSSSSSGIELHKKKDRRDARSRSPMR